MTDELRVPADLTLADYIDDKPPVPILYSRWVEANAYISLSKYCDRLFDRIAKLEVVATAAVERVGELTADRDATVEQYNQAAMDANRADRRASAAEAECARLRVDAERYRWIRDSALASDILLQGCNEPTLLPGYGLDARIDAALAPVVPKD